MTRAPSSLMLCAGSLGFPKLGAPEAGFSRLFHDDGLVTPLGSRCGACPRCSVYATPPAFLGHPQGSSPVLRGLSGPRAVNRDTVGIGPEIELARDEPADVFSPDRSRVSAGPRLKAIVLPSTVREVLLQSTTRASGPFFRIRGWPLSRPSPKFIPKPAWTALFHVIELEAERIAGKSVQDR
ncbi:hypothetical protein SAMN05216236_10187 [Sedimentitalea nanhaiensis]|uniref:Uncharacterized protein n=1 Tax=Sedimentitalea nanhaiensis TaxID=999627 RepID=A0A1I6X787_9RHOB|nr:hypothetical protein SAMN05216236_10187 [Sedimentitalea nanhaiensis]